MPHKRSILGEQNQTLRKQLYDDERERDKRFFKKMSEIDTARSIVRNLSPQNIESGEIVYDRKNEKIIERVLLGTKYRFETDDPAPRNNPLSKHVKQKTHFDYEFIGVPVIERALLHVDSEVLNCSIEPCWWR